MNELTHTSIRRLFWCIGLLTGVWLLGSCHLTRRLSGARPPGLNADTSAAVPVSADSSLRLQADTLLENERDTIQSKMARHRIRFKTFAARAKLNLATPKGAQQDITAFIRVQRDSAIWISIRPLLGIEYMRLLITRDSVKVINYFTKTVYLKSADSLAHVIGLPLDFQTLQNFIVGNPLYLNDSISHVHFTPSVISFRCVQGPILSQFDVFPGDFLLQENKLQDRDSSSMLSCDLVYGDYENTGGQQISTRRRVYITTPKSTQADLKFGKIDLDKAISFPFAYGDKFKIQ